jgi:hypothetical protein
MNNPQKPRWWTRVATSVMFAVNGPQVPPPQQPPNLTPDAPAATLVVPDPDQLSKTAPTPPRTTPTTPAERSPQRAEPPRQPTEPPPHSHQIVGPAQNGRHFEGTHPANQHRTGTDHPRDHPEESPLAPSESEKLLREAGHDLERQRDGRRPLPEPTPAAGPPPGGRGQDRSNSGGNGQPPVQDSGTTLRWTSDPPGLTPMEGTVRIPPREVHSPTNPSSSPRPPHKADTHAKNRDAQADTHAKNRDAQADSHRVSQEPRRGYSSEPQQPPRRYGPEQGEGNGPPPRRPPDK